MSTTAEPRTRLQKLYRIWVIASIPVVALVVVMGIILAFGNWGDDNDSSPQAIPNLTNECAAFPTNDNTNLTSAPAVEQWRWVGDVAVPTHPDHGPANTEGHFSCYAPTPEGALFAAINVLALGSTGQDNTIYTYLAAEGPARDAALQETPADAEKSSGGVELAGFKVWDFREDSARVEVAMSVQGTYGAMIVDFVREDGDWKVDLPTSGDIPFRLVDPSLDGFTRMSPTGGATNG